MNEEDRRWKGLAEPPTLFIQTVADLERRCASGDDYELLGIAALLRKLLLDPPLLMGVNGELRLPIKFHVPKEHKVDPATTFYSAMDAFHPDLLAKDPRSRFVNRDAFLKVLVAHVGGQKVTVKDIITFEANMKGGVHLGEPSTDAQRALSWSSNKVNMKGFTFSLYHLRLIGLVVLNALRPLRDALAEGEKPLTNC